MANQKPNNKKDKPSDVKAYQEINDEIAKNDKLKQKQPTPTTGF